MEQRPRADGSGLLQSTAADSVTGSYGFTVPLRERAASK
jgi:hypothetical protein